MACKGAFAALSPPIEVRPPCVNHIRSPLNRSFTLMKRFCHRVLYNFVRTKWVFVIAVALLWVLFFHIQLYRQTRNPQSLSSSSKQRRLYLYVPASNQLHVSVLKVLWQREQEFDAVRDQCRRLLREEPAAIKQSKQFKLFETRIFDFPVKNCSEFVSRRHYLLHTPSAEEQAFPIAFSIIVYTAASQVERLLRAIYVPHNLYCIHVDANAATEMHEAMASIAGCLDNVFVIPKPRNTMWGSINLVKVELMCAELMLKKNSKWKYFINLTGHEFPLWSNRHLVRILETFRGANDITASSTQIFPERFKFVWRNMQNTGEKKSPPPGGLTMIRGTAHAVASRAFMEAVTTRPLAKKFLAWLEDTFVADEMFFPVLNHNHKAFPVAGGNPEDIGQKNPERRGTVARLKEWFMSWFVFERRQCRGFLERGICIQGAGDLRKLAQASELFVNKLKADRDPLGFRCAEWLHHQRLLNAYSNAQFHFNTSKYANLPFVKHHTR